MTVFRRNDYHHAQIRRLNVHEPTREGAWGLASVTIEACGLKHHAKANIPTKKAPTRPCAWLPI